MNRQRLWQRIILLVVLGYEGAGAMAGGGLLVARPDGSAMDMPVSMMRGTFADFLIPGVILFGLGLLNAGAFLAVLRRHRTDWIWASLAIGGMAVWFFVEILILRQLHWLHAMWGLPVILGGAAALPLWRIHTETMRGAWLIAGIVSSLLYVAMNVIVSLQWPSYSSASQTVSELSAVDAPTRYLWVALGLIYTVLVTTFGWGVRLAADNRRLRVAGTLIVAYGALGIVWPFAPMHMRDVLAAGGGDLRDTLHVALGVLTEVIYLVALGFAATGLGKMFRTYSITTFVVLFGVGALMFAEAPRVGANQPTPLIGVWERVNIGLFLLWVIVLAVALLTRVRSQQGREGRQGRATKQAPPSSWPARAVPL